MTLTSVAILSIICGSKVESPGRAVLVGVDRYPFILEANRLRGAANDLLAVRALCRAAGVEDSAITSLTQSKATASAIQRALDASVREARKGEDVLFYFSGMGGRALATDGTLIATLVPHDAKRDSGSNDVKLARIAKWATEVRAAGANPIVIVDASWSILPTRSESRPYLTTPRTFLRKNQEGELDPVYTGPGVFLAPCNGSGQAFEWKQAEGTYSGAFTDLLTTRMALTALRGERKTIADIVGSVRRVALSLVSQDYMPGFRPIAIGTEPSTFLFQGRYEIPTSGPLAKLIRREQIAAESFRVAIDVDPELSDAVLRNSLYREARRAVSRLTKERWEGVVLVEPDAFRPDRVLIVGRDNGDTILKLSDETQRSLTKDLPVHIGATVEECLAGQLQEIIQRDAYTTRLYRLADTATPTGKGGWTMDFSTQYRILDPFSASITSGDTTGTAFVFDCADHDGTIRMLFPTFREPDVGIEPGKTLRLPANRKMLFTEGSPLGTSEFRVLVVESRPEVLPNQPDAFRSATVTRLKNIIDGIQEGKLAWSAKTVVYQVLPKSGE
jgi:hypothetical protein